MDMTDADPEITTENYAEVLPYLYIGDCKTAKNKSFLQSLGITYVVNATPPREQGGLHNYFRADSQMFKYFRCPVPDSESANISQYFNDCGAFIEAARSHGYGVLVHCEQGKSRSASMVIAYLMKYQHLSLADAYAHLKRVRALVKPNRNFLSQLVQYESDLKNGKHPHKRSRSASVSLSAPQSSCSSSVSSSASAACSSSSPSSSTAASAMSNSPQKSGVSDASAAAAAAEQKSSTGTASKAIGPSRPAIGPSKPPIGPSRGPVGPQRPPSAAKKDPSPPKPVIGPSKPEVQCAGSNPAKAAIGPTKPAHLLSDAKRTGSEQRGDGIAASRKDAALESVSFVYGTIACVQPTQKRTHSMLPAIAECDKQPPLKKAYGCQRPQSH